MNANNKYIKITLATILLSITGLSSCRNYLDVIPDNIPTLDHAFSSRQEAEKFIHKCYSYTFSRTGTGNAQANISFLGGDEMWTYFGQNYAIESPWKIARGEQNIIDPLVSFWDGRNHAVNFWQAIRECNIFLDYVETKHAVPDLDDVERERWIGEIKFLKAYFHFCLMRMYGPIPIMDMAIPISATPEEVRVKRQPVDEVAVFISNLLDEAAVGLPDAITNLSTEAGRVSKTAAMMLKTKLWVTVASPLFNGNPDYASFKDRDGVQLFNPSFDQSKWERAYEAGKDAIEVAERSNHKLYYFNNFSLRLSDSTTYQMNVRGAVTEKWNEELIWGINNHQETNIYDVQNSNMAGKINHSATATYTPDWSSYLSVTLRMAELFYSDNGVPLEEDINFDYQGRYDLQTATDADRFNLVVGHKGPKLHFNRENRFYGSVAFDGAKWFMRNTGNSDEQNTFYVKGKNGEVGGKGYGDSYNVTGYWAKKLVNWNYVMIGTNPGAKYTTEKYPKPEMRLADLYLLFAEAANETDRRQEAIQYLDKIRERAGLSGVISSWTNYSKNPNKPTTKEGLRSIIMQERGIELAFEGHRIWDLRRWKTAELLQNQPIRGWYTDGRTDTEYWRIINLYNMQFVAPRDYFWPIRENNLLVNPNLVQNPGW